MNPDDLKQAWQAQGSPTRLTIDAELLLREVRRNEQSFAATIFWRDVREVGIAVLLVPVWICLGVNWSVPWTWYLTVPALVWVAVYMLVDRIRNKRHAPQPSQPLIERVESSLAEVNHQIRLLRNVLWWYILPPAIPMAIFLGQFAWQHREIGWPIPAIAALLLAQVVAVCAFVYSLNQHAVRTTLEPRRQELEALLASLQGDASPAS